MIDAEFWRFIDCGLCGVIGSVLCGGGVRQLKGTRAYRRGWGQAFARTDVV